MCNKSHWDLDFSSLKKLIEKVMRKNQFSIKGLDGISFGFILSLKAFYF